MRETLAVTLARIEEHVKNNGDNNTKEHQVIVQMIADLKRHVNDENEKMDIRIKTVEDYCNRSKVTWQVLAKVGVTTITVITIAVSIIKLLVGLP